MICQVCGNHEAKVHLKKRINGQEEDIFLCEKCAINYNDISFDLSKIFSSILESAESDEENVSNKSCPGCSMLIDEFNNTGKLGCDQCYDAFADSLEYLLKQLHGNTKHMGKVPKRVYGEIKIAREIEKLRKKLNECIISENYEEAAVIRDKINDLEK